MAEYTSPITGYESDVRVGARYTLRAETLPEHPPEYKAHAGCAVTVTRHQIDGEDYDGEGTRHLVRIRADDRWTGDVWDDELTPIGDAPAQRVFENQPAQVQRDAGYPPGATA